MIKRGLWIMQLRKTLLVLLIMGIAAFYRCPAEAVDVRVLSSSTGTASGIASVETQRLVRTKRTASSVEVDCSQDLFGRHAVTAPSPIKAIVGRTASEYGVESDLVLSVIAVESDFISEAVSEKGARGLMQLLPDTAARFGVTDLFDDESNIVGGVRYLQWLKNRFNGNMSLVLAAYNAGEGAVDSFEGIPPYPETREFLKRVVSHYACSHDDPLVQKTRLSRFNGMVSPMAENVSRRNGGGQAVRIRVQAKTSSKLLDKRMTCWQPLTMSRGFRVCSVN